MRYEAREAAVADSSHRRLEPATLKVELRARCRDRLAREYARHSDDLTNPADGRKGVGKDLAKCACESLEMPHGRAERSALVRTPIVTGGAARI